MPGVRRRRLVQLGIRVELADQGQLAAPPRREAGHRVRAVVAVAAEHEPPRSEPTQQDAAQLLEQAPPSCGGGRRLGVVDRGQKMSHFRGQDSSHLSGCRVKPDEVVSRRDSYKALKAAKREREGSALLAPAVAVFTSGVGRWPRLQATASGALGVRRRPSGRILFARGRRLGPVSSVGLAVHLLDDRSVHDPIQERHRQRRMTLSHSMGLMCSSSATSILSSSGSHHRTTREISLACQ